MRTPIDKLTISASWVCAAVAGSALDCQFNGHLLPSRPASSHHNPAVDLVSQMFPHKSPSGKIQSSTSSRSSVHGRQNISKIQIEREASLHSRAPTHTSSVVHVCEYALRSRRHRYTPARGRAHTHYTGKSISANWLRTFDGLYSEQLLCCHHPGCSPVVVSEFGGERLMHHINAFLNTLPSSCTVRLSICFPFPVSTTCSRYSLCVRPGRLAHFDIFPQFTIPISLMVDST